MSHKGYYCEISDNYDHLDSSLEYVLENVLHETDALNDSDYNNLKDQFNSRLLNGCKCARPCGVEDNRTCSHGHNYKLEGTNLVLSDATGQCDIIYECTDLCPCNSACQNRLVQFGPRKHLKITHSAIYKSLGVITEKDIPQGAFICEYAGELITPAEARKRTIENERNHKMNYILCLREDAVDNTNVESYEKKSLYTIVDPSRRGNIGRYLNHSCSPNCRIFSVRVDCPIPKIAIFANRPILAGEELCFHYNEGVSKQLSCGVKYSTVRRGIECQCGASNCTGYLPNCEFLNDFI